MNQTGLSQADQHDLRRFARALDVAWAVGPWGFLAALLAFKVWDKHVAPGMKQDPETLANIGREPRQSWKQDGRPCGFGHK
jgi:hypothetical protein